MKKALFVFALVCAQPAFAAETPVELRGQFVYPQDSGACQYQNYALTIDASTIEANEFSCKVNRVSRQGSDYILNAACRSEDGRSTKNRRVRVDGDALIFDNMRYLRCGAASPAAASAPAAAPAPSTAAPTTAQSLPGVCRDDDLKGGPKRIYTDSRLKRVSKDHDSSGTGFIPQQSIVAGINPAYRGTIFALSNGRDYPGQYYIDVNEWAGLCK
jgi:hypothetical protein